MTQRLATWMALWLLAISLAAPAHQLEHVGVGSESALELGCDFFVHSHQLTNSVPAAELHLPTASQAVDAPQALQTTVVPQRCRSGSIRAPPQFLLSR